MSFASPQWLLLIPIAGLLGWRFRQLRLSEPLRILSLLFLILALSNPQWNVKSSPMALWVVTDHSASIAQHPDFHPNEWESILKNTQPKGTQIHFVDYAAAPFERQSGTTPELDPSRTRTGLALDYTLSLIDQSRPSRVLLITDGYATDRVSSISEKYQQQGVPMDLRLIPDSPLQQTRIARFSLPSSRRMGEAFLLEADIQTNTQTEIPYSILKDGIPIHQGHAFPHHGKAFIRLQDRQSKPGMHLYQIQIHPKDEVQGSGHLAKHWLEIRGSSRVLLLTRFESDPIASALQTQGSTVQVISHPRQLSVAHLANVSAVIINDIPASLIPSDFLNALDFFVRSQGGGLAMMGGTQAFGQGGYFQSPIDALLPVSMESREDQHKLPIAIAIVMDRSGSMMAGAGPNVSKMDLANEGAARSVELLSPKDFIAVLAVDTTPHHVIPLTEIADRKIDISRQIRRITSQGGGIFVFEGLQAAWKELQKAPPKTQKHIILFSDAADSEQPGDYKDLISEIRTQGGSISVIGLGSEADSDAALLQDIAARGEGRIFFNADAHQLPAIFSQETVAIARSTFIHSPTPTRAQWGWQSIGSHPPNWLPEVDAYNLTYTKPQSSVALVSADEHQAPLVSFWQQGAGHVAAVTFPMAGANATLALAWKDYSRFIQSLTHWLEAKSIPQGISLQTKVRGERMDIELRFDSRYEPDFAKSMPRLWIADSKAQTPKEISWERMEPGRLHAEIPIPEAATEWLRGAVEIGTDRLPFGPLTLETDPEWNRDTTIRDAIKRLPEKTGGQVLQNLSNAWTQPSTRSPQSLQELLLWLWLGAFLADCLLSQLGISLCTKFLLLLKL